MIATARGLTETGGWRPSQANLRRAVSTAYYAMFHCLAGTAADLLIGRRRNEAWHRVYRALEHGRARTACEHKRAMGAFPPAVRGFADMFVVLQKVRQQADYALDVRFDKPDVLAAIDRAENTIAKFALADIRDRRSFAAHVLFKRRTW